MKRRISGVFLAAVMIITTCLAGVNPVFAEEDWNPDSPDAPYVWGDDTDYDQEDSYDDGGGQDVQVDTGFQIIDRNGVSYMDFTKAVNGSSNGDVIKLVHDVVLAAPILVEWTWEGTLTIDLNGYKIRMYGADENISYDNSGRQDDGSGGMFILYGGTLRVTDSAASDPYSSSGGIESSNDSQPVFRLMSKPDVPTNLIIDSGCFSADVYDNQQVIGFMDAYGNRISPQDADNLSVSLTGGYYNQQQPDDFIASGYAQSAYDGSWWQVQQSWDTYYTVTFDSQAPDVESPASQSVQEGSTVQDPGSLSRDGYTFGGWYDLSTGGWYDFSQGVYSDLNLGAWWTQDAPNTYTVTFSSQADDVPSPQPQTVEEGGTVTYPGDLSRDGYTFSGWYNLDTGDWYDFSQPVYSNLNLGVWWVQETVTHTVTFDPQADDVYPPQSQTVADGSPAADPGALTRDGYSFDGWYQDPYGETAYSFDTPVYSDITIYAQWKRIYDSVYGSTVYEKGSEEGIIFEINADYSKFDHVMLDGEYVDPGNYYSWEGSTFVQLGPWYTDQLANGEHTIEFDFTDGYCKTSFTVKEQDAPQTFTVTFSFNGLKADPYLVVNVPSRHKVDIPPAPSGTDGYAFAGWYADPECRTPYYFNEPVLQDMTLYADWKQEETTAEMFSVTFYTAHGLTPDGQLVEYGARVLRPDEPWEEGYVFEGWYSDIDYINLYDFNAPVSSNLTLYAKWSERPTTILYYKVSFYTERGVAPEAQTVENGHIAYRPQDPSADGFVFSGWFTDRNFQYPYDFNTPVRSDLILYASWSPLPSQNFIVSFDSNGHGDAPNAQTVKRGEPAPRPADPRAAGYTFSGWFTDAACTAAYDFRNPVNADITLFAKWIANTYTVRFDANGGSGTMPSQVYTYGVAATLPASQFNRSGYNFTGWNTSADGTGQAIADRADVINLTTEPGATVALFAQWKNIYSVIEGAESKIQRGTKQGLTFRVDGDYSKFTGIKVDGNNVSTNAYTSWSGSTYVQLKPEYINQLTAETHTIRFMFQDGAVETRFEILSGTPTTGDTSNTIIWIIIAIAALLIIIITVLVLVRRRREATAGAYHDSRRYDRYDDRYEDNYDDEDEYDDDDRY